MKTIATLLMFIIALCLPQSTWAIVNPLDVPNNKFGIHIIDTGDLDAASKLVNSSGGNWGYVTLVIREDERDLVRWNGVFDKIKELNLIPIVRIATSSSNGTWDRLEVDDISSWITFLNSLNWPIKNRYVVVGNEPNHAKEWGGEVDPGGYSIFLKTFSLNAKTLSEDFYILNAGFDASAPNSSRYMSEDVFIKSMLSVDPQIFEHIDGWVSHSYPNPGFSGSSSDTGRGTVKTYVWEKELLNSLGVQKELPIFITETGWAHDIEGSVLGQSSYGAERFNFKTIDEVSIELKRSFGEVWIDEDIVTITPFVLSHPDYPFENFSWKNADGSFYKFYDDIAGLPKVSGDPIKTNNWLVHSMYSIGDNSAIALIESTKNLSWSIADRNTIGNLEIKINPLSSKEIELSGLELAYIETLSGEPLEDIMELSESE